MFKIFRQSNHSHIAHILSQQQQLTQNSSQKADASRIIRWYTTINIQIYRYTPRCRSCYEYSFYPTRHASINWFERIFDDFLIQVNRKLFCKRSLNAYVWPIILANIEPKGLFSPEKKNLVLFDRDLAISSWIYSFEYRFWFASACFFFA